MAKVAGSSAVSEADRSTPDASSLARHRAPNAPPERRPANRALVPSRANATEVFAGPPPGCTVRCAAPSTIPSGGRTASATTSPTMATVATVNLAFGSELGLRSGRVVPVPITGVVDTGYAAAATGDPKGRGC